MQSGVYMATKKDGTIYYRSSINYSSKHVSLGSFDNEDDAHDAYMQAGELYHNLDITLENLHEFSTKLPFEKVITILNHRDHNIYIKTPIYLRNGYFSYFLNEKTELKFDNDDLFFYSSHKILAHGGHLYVNDYGMQYGILNRYGIKNFAVAGKDYIFANGDTTDYRYSNIIVQSMYHGVKIIEADGVTKYEVKIHLNGDFLIGRYNDQITAGVAYNKAVDFAKDHGYEKQFIENYIIDCPPAKYAQIYTEIKLPKKYRNYIKEFCQ